MPNSRRPCPHTASRRESATAIRHGNNTTQRDGPDYRDTQSSGVVSNGGGLAFHLQGGKRHDDYEH